jgi:hypothetical protein
MYRIAKKRKRNRWNRCWLALTDRRRDWRAPPIAYVRGRRRRQPWPEPFTACTRRCRPNCTDTPKKYLHHFAYRVNLLRIFSDSFDRCMRLKKFSVTFLVNPNSQESRADCARRGLRIILSAFAGNLRISLHVIPRLNCFCTRTGSIRPRNRSIHFYLCTSSSPS